MHHASPFRTAPLACPRCPSSSLGAGALRMCTACQGAWVPDDALHERVSTMQAGHPRLEWRRNENRRGLACPQCRQTMEALLLFTIPVDRCHAHGVWFDGGELAAVLERSAEVRGEPPPAAAVAVASGASTDTSNAGSDLGVLDAVGGVLEILGDLFSIIDL